jgi:hypothetical protein
MDRFLGKQGATEELFHDVAVLKHLAAGFAGAGRNSDHDVSSFDTTSQLSVRKAFVKLSALPIGLALGVAKFLLPIVGRVSRLGLVALHGVGFAALLAGEGSAGFCVGPATESRTGDRAVKRVFPKFLSIFRQIGGFVGKGFPAGLAGELYRRDLCGRSTVDRLMGAPAVSPAKAGVSGMGRFDPKGHAAVVADFLNPYRLWHVITPLLGGLENGIYRRSAQVVFAR